ncbi:MAG: hypothetical protein JW818_05315 [Pirellulales bacterium]|nr:hypothetical protein [Pirellulales bacterium]
MNELKPATKSARAAKRKARLPELSPLQFVAMGLLLDGERRIDDFRAELTEHGGPKSASAFSQLMDRLARSSYVTYRFERVTCEGFTTRRRICRITDLGLLVWQATRQFYATFSTPAADLVPEKVDETQYFHLPPKERRARATKEFAKTLEDIFLKILNQQAR